MTATAIPIPIRIRIPTAIKIMFKEDLLSDRDIFLNDNEFAEMITVDGVELKAVRSEYNSKKSSNKAENFAGLFGDFTNIYFKTDDYLATRKRLPNHGEFSIINGKRYVVETCADEGGICKLVLSAYRQAVLR